MQRQEMELLAVRATLWRMEIEILREIHPPHWIWCRQCVEGVAARKVINRAAGSGAETSEGLRGMALQ